MTTLSAKRMELVRETVKHNKYYSGHSKAAEEYCDKRTRGREGGERKIDSRCKLQLEEDGGDSIRQNWMSQVK